MMKLLLIFFLSLGFTAFPQVEQSNYAGAISEFRALYNSGDYEGIFDNFDVDMKKALPRQNTIQFFTEQVNGLMGAIKEMRFYGLKKGAHIYRTIFDRAVADILISLNPKNEINGLYISPPKSMDLPLSNRPNT